MILVRVGQPNSLRYVGSTREPRKGGVQHQVTVLESGVLFRGKHHRSLSEVARVITGSRWSGPLFFGLKKCSREEATGDGAR